ncbi:MAG: DNA methyltransferase [candidate division WOR-3 bacterium]
MLIVTDPPFAIDFKTIKNKLSWERRKLSEGYCGIPKDKYYEFSVNWLKEIYRTLKDTSSVYLSGYKKYKFNKDENYLKDF